MTLPKNASPQKQPASDVNSQQAANYGTASNPTGTGSSVKKRDTSKIEPKVWLANERTWLVWCRTGVLLGSFGVALLNSSPSIGAQVMGVVYAFIAIGIISYGWLLYQKRVRLINERYAGHFDELWPPLVIAGSLFVAILSNFVFRAIDSNRYHSPNHGAASTPWVAAPASSHRI